ncbi:hypothetical protein D9M71_643860 [compost metagenome]
MAVPPLDHGVGGARIRRVGFEQTHRQRHMIDHMDHAGNDDEGPVEPVANINVADLPPGDGAEEEVGVDHPQQGDPEGDRPLHFGVFLGGCDTQRIAEDHCRHSDLPAPEHEVGQPVGNESSLARALDDIE